MDLEEIEKRRVAIKKKKRGLVEIIRGVMMKRRPPAAEREIQSHSSALVRP